jgi:hypothetical protein
MHQQGFDLVGKLSRNHRIRARPQRLLAMSFNLSTTQAILSQKWRAARKEPACGAKCRPVHQCQRRLGSREHDARQRQSGTTPHSTIRWSALT